MQAPLTGSSGLSRGLGWFLAVAWLVILAKCLTVPWVFTHWQIPVHPAWVIVPTLLLAALATWLVLRFRKE